MKKVLLIQVFDEEKEIDSFEFSFEGVPGLITLPEDFYHGLSFQIGTDGKGGYEFSPDGYEMWIRFSDNRVGQLIEYINGKSYKFLFITKSRP